MLNSSRNSDHEAPRRHNYVLRNHRSRGNYRMMTDVYTKEHNRFGSNIDCLLNDSFSPFNRKFIVTYCLSDRRMSVKLNASGNIAIWTD